MCVSVSSHLFHHISFDVCLPVCRLGHMHAGHNANVKRYTQIKEDLAASESVIQQLEGSSNNNAEQYKFLQEMRGYVGDLLECFSEKVRENLCGVSLAVCSFVSFFFYLKNVF